MSIPKFIIGRLGLAVFVLLGLSILIFLIARVIPGDPARMALGPRAPEYALENLRKEMNLDKPVYIQYYLWLSDFFTKGYLGKSLITRRPVEQDIIEFLPATLEMVILAAIFLAGMGIGLGILSAQYRNSFTDAIFRVIAYLGIATPSFVWLIIFILLFGYLMPIFPVLGRLTPGVSPPPRITGMYILDGLLTGNLRASWDTFLHLVLPSIALAMGGMSQAARIIRSGIVDNINKDYTALYKAYGFTARLIFSKYLLKTSLIPAVSIMGLDIAALFANAFVIEKVINFPGLSNYGMNAILNKDLNAIVGTIMVLGITFASVTIIIDIIVAYLDPRIRLITKESS